MSKAKTSHKNQAAVELGRLGGVKGGPARANKLSVERRSEIARTAAAARWSSNNKSEGKAMPPVTWTKLRLTRSEALLPTRGSLMPFLRFTKERYSFDHTTWFRNTLFASAPWRRVPASRARERATIDVDVTILGHRLGVRNLTIDYDPDRAINHSAPTVHLHYDAAIENAFHSSNVAGHRAVVTAHGNRYSLEII